MDNAIGQSIRAATADDLTMIVDFLAPFFENRILLRRSNAEIGELARHGFLFQPEDQCLGFAAVEIYSRKLAEIQCLAVAESQRGHGVGRFLVSRCIHRAQELGVMEVLAISNSEEFLRSCGFDYSLPDQKRALFYQLRPRE